MRKLPKSYLLALLGLAVIVVIVGLVWFSVPPFDNIQAFVLFNFIGVVVLLILGVVGGAFVGMLFAHRILGNREFSPFERDVLRSLQEIRDRLDALEARRPPEEERLRR